MIIQFPNFGQSGGGGTGNYNDLTNKPSIGGVTLIGNSTFEMLRLETTANRVTGITSGATDTQYPTAKAVNDKFEGYYTSGQTDNAISAATANMPTSSTITTIWKGSRADYDAIATKDNATFYIIVENSN